MSILRNLPEKWHVQMHSGSHLTAVDWSLCQNKRSTRRLTYRNKVTTWNLLATMRWSSLYLPRDLTEELLASLLLHFSSRLYIPPTDNREHRNWPMGSQIIQNARVLDFRTLEWAGRYVLRSFLLIDRVTLKQYFCICIYCGINKILNDMTENGK